MHSHVPFETWVDLNLLPAQGEVMDRLFPRCRAGYRQGADNLLGCALAATAAGYAPTVDSGAAAAAAPAAAAAAPSGYSGAAAAAAPGADGLGSTSIFTSSPADSDLGSSFASAAGDSPVSMAVGSDAGGSRCVAFASAGAGGTGADALALLRLRDGGRLLALARGVLFGSFTLIRELLGAPLLAHPGFALVGSKLFLEDVPGGMLRRDPILHHGGICGVVTFNPFRVPEALLPTGFAHDDTILQHVIIPLAGFTLRVLTFLIARSSIDRLTLRFFFGTPFVLRFTAGFGGHSGEALDAAAATRPQWHRCRAASAAALLRASAATRSFGGFRLTPCAVLGSVTVCLRFAAGIFDLPLAFRR